MTVTRTVEILNEMGLHARPSAKIAKLASTFDAEVTLRNGDILVPAKSIMQLLNLLASEGTELVIEGEGPQAEEAVAAIADLIASRFGEDR